MAELKIDSDKVKAAAEACPDAKKVLTVLFPELFPAPKTVPEINGSAMLFPEGHPMRHVIQIRSRYSFYKEQSENGLFLDDSKGYSFSIEEVSTSIAGLHNGVHHFLRVRAK